ncbi:MULTISPECIES: fimbrial protein [unclassified Serratia (in: enterobacteria)]|uniref:fimbrial protein n=1 Tax=unclassified Serratia (in: enterobacteria) TaxID=2647522 RepID=UPI000AB8D672|nr:MULTISPECIES: fimbrial protein [unclassified Serratia (in: enterobacteria)]
MMNINNMMKKILMLGCLFWGSCFLSPMAQAANYGCTSTPDIPGVATLTSTAVSTSLPVGSVIPGTERSFSFSGNCAAISTIPQGIAIITCYYGVGGEVSGMPGVYDTGVSGVGITLINSAGQRVVGAGPGCDTRGTPLGYISNTSGKTFSVSMTLALVKTAANIVPGTLHRSQTIFGIGMYNTGYGLGSNADSSVSYSGDVTYKSITCSVGSGDGIVPVPLGNVPAAQFSGINTTAGAQPFNIPVTCNDRVNVSMSMSAPGYISVPNGVIALTPAGNNAGGVGVQILYNGNPVAFNQFFAVGTVANTGATLSIPFVAQYFQYAISISPGTANAMATATLEYQ